MGCGHLVDDLAVGEEQHPVCVAGRDRVVGHHDHGLAELLDGGPEEAEQLGAGPGVEGAGGLVREHDLRTAGECASRGDALLLPAGQLRRTVREPLGEPDRLDDRLDPERVRLATGDLDRQHDVLRRGQRRQQVERLEDEADLVAAQQGERLVLQRRDLGVADVDLPGGRPVEAGQHVQQRRLAGAGRAHDRGELTGGEADADVVQRVHGVVAVAVGLADVRRPGGGPRDAGGRD